MEKITVERSIWIGAPRERVWQAVTDLAQVQQWFAPTTTLFQKGNRISIRVGEMEMEVAEVELLDPPRQITTRSLQEPSLTTTYLLAEENGGTRFTVIEAGFELLSPEARQARADQDGKGWEMALENLHAYLDGKSLPHPEGF
jgi:uncharacterized protein YndB with AHSA1/START domain